MLNLCFDMTLLKRKVVVLWVKTIISLETLFKEVFQYRHVYLKYWSSTFTNNDDQIIIWKYFTTSISRSTHDNCPEYILIKKINCPEYTSFFGTEAHVLKKSTWVHNTSYK